MRVRICFLLLMVSGCCETTPDLRAFVVERGREMRAGHLDTMIARSEAYLNHACTATTHVDSVRIAYLYSHLQRAYYLQANYASTVKAYERGRLYQGLLSDTLQVILLRGAATAFTRQGRSQAAQRLALKSMTIAHRRGYIQARDDSWLCWLDAGVTSSPILYSEIIVAGFAGAFLALALVALCIRLAMIRATAWQPAVVRSSPSIQERQGSRRIS